MLSAELAEFLTGGLVLLLDPAWHVIGKVINVRGRGGKEATEVQPLPFCDAWGSLPDLDHGSGLRKRIWGAGDGQRMCMG